ncbi:hypothetical protein [Domibacillus robiginosus]|uniref:hypothetical protein n=1 Tax=Domibacillus robiginosus TaxID=1071054 RepID=UPI00067CFEFD|nr:hypothetical protein [Domibacillus robiginosus]
MQRMHNHTATSSRENSNKASKFSISYAKLPYDLLFQYGKGELCLSPAALNFLIEMTPYLDQDNTLVIPVDYLREKMAMQKRTLERVLTELQGLNLIEFDTQTIISHFHLQVKQGDRQTYVRLFDEFVSPAFKGYSTNLKRLFTLVAARMSISNGYVVSLYNMWNTKRDGAYIHRGITYFNTVKDLADALSTLIKNDQITVELMSKEGSTFLHKDSENPAEQLLAFYEKSETQQFRTSRKAALNKKVCIRLSDRVLEKEVVDNTASFEEIKQLAARYEIEPENLSQDLYQLFTYYKNELIDQFGFLGLTIYRKALSKYFDDNGVLVIYHDSIKEKAANYLVDFYILPLVREFLKECVVQSLDESLHTKEIDVFTFSISSETIGKLLLYYSDHGSVNHAVQLDEELTGVIGFEGYDRIPVATEYFIDFETVIHKVYNKEFIQVKDRISKGQWMRQIQKWAANGLLARKEKFEELVHEIKRTYFAVETFLAKWDLSSIAGGSSGTVERSNYAIPFYNWLNE